MANSEELISRLENATEQARATLRTTHEVIKDLRALQRDLNAFADRVRAEAEKVFKNEVQARVAELQAATEKAIETTTELIYARFDKITNILLGEEAENPGASLEELAEEYLKRKRVYDKSNNRNSNSADGGAER